MIFDEKRFPILGSIENNILTDKVFQMLENSGYDDEGIADIRLSFDFFKNKTLQINYISSTIHDKLLDTKNFVKAKSLLLNSDEATGLLILPKTILPDFSNVPDYAKTDPNDYPINAILYSWLSANNHGRILNKRQLENLKQRVAAGEKPPQGADWESLMNDLNDEEELWEEKNRTLIIVPIHNNRITQGTRQLEMIGYDEQYGDENSSQEMRAWYGKIHDYVMSFLLFYNFTDTETHIINGSDNRTPKKIKLNNEKFLNETKNNVEIIDVTYFTKIIRTGEFPVDGHFRVQNYGSNNASTKIIFIEGYSKNGYTRTARIDKN